MSPHISPISLDGVTYMALEWHISPVTPAGSHRKKPIKMCSRWSETCRNAVQSLSGVINIAYMSFWRVSRFGHQSKCMCMMAHPQHHTLENAANQKFEKHRRVIVFPDESDWCYISFRHIYIHLYISSFGHLSKSTNICTALSTTCWTIWPVEIQWSVVGLMFSLMKEKIFYVISFMYIYIYIFTMISSFIWPCVCILWR